MELDIHSHSSPSTTGALSLFRKEARKSCERLGWPNRQSEAWRYTTLKSLKDIPWVPASLNQEKINAENVRALLKEEHFNLVFVNGTFLDNLSSALPPDLLWTEATDLPLSASPDVFEKFQAAYFEKRFMKLLKLT